MERIEDDLKLALELADEAGIEPAGALWDFAALKVIVEEAGGWFTDFSGNPTASGGCALSSNGGPLHAELLAMLE